MNRSGVLLHCMYPRDGIKIDQHLASSAALYVTTRCPCLVNAADTVKDNVMLLMVLNTSGNKRGENM